MNPILLGKEVEEGLRDLVRSSFDTTSPAYEGMIDRFLEDERNLIKGPWISVDLPFRLAEAEKEFFSEVPLGYRPYRHQELAFQRLQAPKPRSTLVATGTGSGKTESFLWPILDACRARKNEPGIKAIIIYPMNALATDQARRIAKAVYRTPALKGVRCGIYADAEPKQPVDVMTEIDVITRRDEMLSSPPDILLTNYKMLDLLLLRGRDKRLWGRNGPETLRYLVVDELHTFDGAQGADLALLIRRLKARLATPEGHLACVGSSATLGSGIEAAERLVTYASDLFGERFDLDSVIREDRLRAHEYLGSIDYTELPNPEELEEAVRKALAQTQPLAAQSLARLFFDDLNSSSKHFDKRLPSDPNDAQWRLGLGERLRAHVAFHRVLEAMQTCGKAASLNDLVDALAGARLFRGGWSKAGLGALIESIVILTAWARSGDETRLSPLLNVRIQLWARELARMTATIPAIGDDGALSHASLHHSDDLEDHQLAQTLPVIHCRHCGTTGQLGRISTTDSSIGADLKTIYEDFFDGGPHIRYIFFEPINRLSGKHGYGSVVAGHIHPQSLVFQWSSNEQEARDSRGDRLTPFWIYDPIDGSNVDRTCPACGTPHGLQILGLRSARLSSTLATTLFNSEHHEQDAASKPRVLIFSDSVQDAAQRAAVTEIRNVQTVFRKALFNGVNEAPNETISLVKLTTDWISSLREQHGEDSFIARFVARDQTWRDTYQVLALTDKAPDTPYFGDDVALRLGWEFFSDLTYRSRTSQTLETARLALADVDPVLVGAAAEKVRLTLEAKMGPDFALSPDQAHAFVWGLCTHMRRAGAVSHPYVALAAEEATRKGPNFFAARRILAPPKLGVLPIPDDRFSASPRLPTLRSNVERFQFVSRDNPTNWYRAWANLFFGEKSTFLATLYSDLYEATFDALRDAGIADVFGAEGEAASWLLLEDKVLASSRLEHFECDRCGRRESALASVGAPQAITCLKLNCGGSLRGVEDSDPRAKPSLHLQSVMQTSRNHRVVAREHTGILEADDRRALENAFINGDEPWHPNLISATPTLEMGIDIGDLSTLMLASMPPEEANYVQRIGRTGRRDGNSFNMTLISARAHDLQFWETPRSMLSGEVTPPGIHLQAAAVLKRQAAAYALDRLVQDSPGEFEYGKVSGAIASLERQLHADFPLNWFGYLQQHGEGIAESFVQLLPEQTRGRESLCETLRNFICGDGEASLRFVVQSILTNARVERDELLGLQKVIDAERRRLKAASPPPDDLDDQLKQLTRRRAEVSRTLKDTITNVEVLKFLTDRGLLPNYAFPEEGVKLKSVLFKSTDTRSEQAARVATADPEPIIREYIRSASQALSEFAPNQTFYAEGREVTIDRIDLQAKDLSGWRFCSVCTHAEPEITATNYEACPKCRSSMWVDTGSRSETVDLRSVVATSTEQKAAIRDLDSRTQRAYDRITLPSYSDDAIEFAYAITEPSDLGPFGFEFIPQCEFRDLNFGQRTAGRNGRTIAGEIRQSRPFNICRRCGKLQHPNNPPQGDHQAGCVADKGKEDRAAWEAPVYLMRRFTTEAIRIVVPTSGRPNDDDNKSFVAAIELGLKKHFAGRVDHIRSIVVQERLSSGARVRNLYLYDTIPGGSGYLRQLAATPSTMMDVFRRAQASLRDCSCQTDETRNGCFRCVKPYRSQFGPGEPKRDIAMQLVDAVLAQWPNLIPVERVNHALSFDLVESELEARFLDVLAKTFGVKNLQPIVLDTGRRGFQLNAGSAAEPVYWTIEPQVQIDQRFSGFPRKRVDFLLTSKAQIGRKPIVVELDGWEHHAGSIGADIETRMEIIRSGNVEVWTLTWDDLEEILPSHPFQPGNAPPSVDGVLAQIMTDKRYGILHEHKSGIEQLRITPTLRAFVTRLKVTDTSIKPGVALFCRLLMQASGLKADLLALDERLNDDAKFFLSEADILGFAEAHDLRVYFGMPDVGPLDIPGRCDEFRFVLSVDMIGENATRHLSSRAKSCWAAFWRTLNVLQAFRNVHVIFPDLDTLPAMATRESNLENAPDADRTWEDIADELDENMRGVLAALHAAGVSPPDMIGEDLLIGDRIVGMIEIGWRDACLGIALDDFAADGWTLFSAPDPDAPDFVAILERIISKLKGAQ